MFLAQSWLVATHRTVALGEIGLGLAILSLAQWAADWGGTLLLSRHAAVDDTSGYIRAAILFRLCLTPLILLATGSFVVGYTDAPLIRGLILGGSASVVLWALNLTGYLDGKGKSALSGPVSGLCWFTASIAVVVVNQRTFAAGLTIGLCFTVGILATVLIQYAIAARNGIGVGFRMPPKADIRRFAKEGTLMCSADLPAQIYGRCIILIAAAYLGSEATGTYVYIRQILVGSIQAINFLLRVEFPYVVRYILAGSAKITGIIRLQRWSIGSSLLTGVAIAAVAMFLDRLLPQSFQRIAQLLPYFSVLVPAAILDVILGQSVIASDAVALYSIVILCTTAGSVICILSTITRVGLLSIVLGETAMYSVQTLLFVSILRSRVRAVR